MLHSMPLPQLIRPVVNRAQANVLQSISGFMDSAAVAVLERLNIDVKRYPIEKRKKRCIELYRCKWIDQRVIQLALRQPTAVCVEISGGLSTRFHRISQQLEYPRFSFISVNNQSTHRHIKTIFPKTDNHRLVEKRSPINDWHHEVKPSLSQPYILIFGENDTIDNPQVIDSILLRSQRCLREAATSIDILICHHIDHFQEIINQQYPQIQFIKNAYLTDQKSLNSHKNINLFDKLLTKIKWPVIAKCPEKISHIRIT